MLNASPADLARIGLGAYGGESPYPMGAQSAELDEYVIFALEAGNYPEPRTIQYGQLRDRFLAELGAAGDQAPPWGVVGAWCVATNFMTEEDRDDSAYLDLMDSALSVLRDDGVAYTSIPPFALRRWEQVRGYNGLGPAEWPRALEDMPVPVSGEEPEAVDLAEDEERPMCSDGPGEDARTTYAHRTPAGPIVAIVDGADMSDGVRKRWELDGVAANSYTSFLRALGDRLSTPPWWTHEDLQPYFPCRQRSRDEMRDAAKTAGL